ncbi:MAG: hypothetical protein L0I95_13485 [Tetragenococcus koreensis]|nr:hypothetical protein [Tetragenococcus koreensis]MDN6606472.1 hypothetical protein [Tetragenococcus halophilus]MDN6146065.1 hypothetical protein [Tetragenococcus koreensis]MDN6497323.1 hypothetical protein [Tetragenococcus koreensis]MDN6579985.1 hypothetical protein [Tetragenococcus koreensis]
MKYPKLLERIEKLELETYCHYDNAPQMYEDIMDIVEIKKPNNKKQEQEIIFAILGMLEEHHYESLIDDVPLIQFELV